MGFSMQRFRIDMGTRRERRAERVAGHQDEPTDQVRMMRGDCPIQLHPVAIGHPDVGDHEIERLHTQQGKRFLAAWRRRNPIPVPLQAVLKHGADLLLVVDNEDGRFGRRGSKRGPSGQWRWQRGTSRQPDREAGAATGAVADHDVAAVRRDDALAQ